HTNSHKHTRTHILAFSGGLLAGQLEISIQYVLLSFHLSLILIRMLILTLSLSLTHTHTCARTHTHTHTVKHSPHKSTSPETLKIHSECNILTHHIYIQSPLSLFLSLYVYMCLRVRACVVHISVC